MIAHLLTTARSLLRAHREAADLRATVAALRDDLAAAGRSRAADQHEIARLTAANATERMAHDERLRRCDMARAKADARVLTLEVELADARRTAGQCARQLDEARCEVARLSAQSATTKARSERLAKDCAKAARRRA